ncbi:cytochrome P450 [Natrialbaceae archaeon A-CW2]
MSKEIQPEWTPLEIATESGQRDPYPWFKDMRAKGPIRYDERRDAFDVFEYDLVTEVLTDWKRFTRRNTSFIDGAMMSRGPPEHTELRGMADEYFMPGEIRTFSDAFETQAEQLLDETLPPSGTTELEFVDAIAKPLPIMIIANMLGVPTEKMDTFREWSTTLAEAPPELTPEAKEKTEARRNRALEQINEFFRIEIEKREAEPRDDLITKFVRKEQGSDTIDRENTVAQCGMLLVAGNVTTTTYMANAMWTFLEEDCIESLRQGEMPLRESLQEVLRYRSPVMPGKRFATEDTRLAGVDIHEGAKVIGWISSANRDEAAFENPDSFDPTQTYHKQPVAFGKGIHYCLGAPLANMEAEIMLSKFLERADTIELCADEITPFISPEIYGPVELPIRVTVS